MNEECRESDVTYEKRTKLIAKRGRLLTDCWLGAYFGCGGLTSETTNSVTELMMDSAS